MMQSIFQEIWETSELLIYRGKQLALLMENKSYA